MHSLADLQTRIASIATARNEAAVDGLIGGLEPRKRLAIHTRHYLASLTEALHDKFPACRWLVGGELFQSAAEAYVRTTPPSDPCIANYGADFPGHLATFGRAPALPYLASFGALEWATGKAAIAVSHAPLPWQEIACVPAETLIDSRVTAQPGTHYVRAPWRVDELLRIYLRGDEPERFVLQQSDAYVEVRGARGEVDLIPLDRATFEFRRTLSAGATIGEAADLALAADMKFEPGVALRALLDSRLVVRLTPPQQEHPR